jgi:serine/threonine-protein kinase RsbT
MANETRVEITSSIDIVSARQQGRALAQKLGFTGSQSTLITAAISEVARNIVDYARHGEIILAGTQDGARHGIKIVARDEGPGISDIAQAMQYGYSTRNSLGVGLPGAKWLMDEFDIESKLGKGTTVTMKKWTGHFGYPNH